MAVFNQACFDLKHLEMLFLNIFPSATMYKHTRSGLFTSSQDSVTSHPSSGGRPEYGLLEVEAASERHLTLPPRA
jgi:hypothetical protein